MDAAFFRFLGPELVHALDGVRLDTVYSPAPGFWTIAFTPPVSTSPDTPPDCRFLLARVHPRDGILLLSPAKPANPPAPPARAMWLRKRLRNRKIVGGACDWPRKRLALELSSGEGRWLLLTMEDDPVVLDRLPDGFGGSPPPGGGREVPGPPQGLPGSNPVPAWKSAAEAVADPACPRSLRRAIDREEPEGRAALLDAFLEGREGGFYLSDSGKINEGPLPWPQSRESIRFKNALEAAQAFGHTGFFAALTPADEEPKRAEVRREKRLASLDQDRRRLEGLAAQQLLGEAVAANLSALNPRDKLGPMELDHPEHGPILVPLDPSLTILENMERFFRKAAKGRRGQAHVERLRAEANQGMPRPPRSRVQGPKALQAGPGSPVLRSKPGKGGGIPLHRFRSSDGFVILRGKNSAANHKLLSELASPFDYWLHAEGGPGAHVIIKRDHPGQEIPDSTLREAAVLAGLSSWARDARRLWA